MKISDANSSIASRKTRTEGSGMEAWPQHKIQNLQSRGKTEKRWEDEINEFLRKDRIEEEKTMMREITIRGSRQSKIGKVGRKWKAVLQ